jgi:hypothetical protein
LVSVFQTCGAQQNETCSFGEVLAPQPTILPTDGSRAV